MRIWSLHPCYLDTKGLLALWRESLLAKNVLLNNTKGYKNHPQLIRFKESENPLQSIDYYLSVVHAEAEKRNYKFSKEKFAAIKFVQKIPVTSSQVDFECTHLLNKLTVRDKLKYEELLKEKEILLHPLFYSVKGDIEPWEKIKSNL